ncbi:NADP-dependent oxidoreductase domain-containing protein [Microdochium trichocladiopsis]|uniref:NADP-dependent oxidoreductase domain-containing protein n=1 Tax=Microdochium trichocladiopsis TaxID=1682393 RepID=A0A9P8YC17_9PEZI|nr:NADP-dependent oxidoreductase domain-containing protein [Microdochium trichocladiopsis]KAH7033554.1 NADP-dependent oxidoreductase domain-containing protein [Microdochium trichocladiopsis]
MAGPHIVFGAGGIGISPGSFTYTFDTPEKVSSLLKVLESLDIKELDSAANYPPKNPWNTNTLLGQAGAAGKGFEIHDKIRVPYNYETGQVEPSLTEEAMAASTKKSQQLLGVDKVPVLYAHFRDPHTSIEEMARAFDVQHKLGSFDKLGLCNFSAADLKEYFAVCEKHGYVKPSIIQDMYNPLYRKAEDDILPLIRQHGCAFYAYSPLAGGFLTGKVTPPAPTDNDNNNNSDNKSDNKTKDSVLHRSRWRGESAHPVYTQTYDSKAAMHDAVRKLVAACNSSSSAGGGGGGNNNKKITPQEATCRWLLNHSALREGDAIILGASSEAQLVANVAAARVGPLSADDAELRGVLDGLWDMVKD